MQDLLTLKETAKSQYGDIHNSIRGIVLKRYGRKLWDQVLEQSGLEDCQHFASFNNYDDDVFMKLVRTVSQVVGIPETTVLEGHGDSFLSYCMELGYDKLLVTLGENLYSFLQNLDALHALLSISYKGLRPPSFRCERQDRNTLTLHYYSSRKGLYPMVTGMLKAVARDIFQEEVSVSAKEITLEDSTNIYQKSHFVFKIVTLQSVTTIEEHQDVKGFLIEKAKIAGAMAAPVTVSAFCKMFPYHILFDKNLKVINIGEYAKKLLKEDMLNCDLSDVVDIVEPKMSYSFDSISKFVKETFVIKIKDDRYPDEEKIMLKGKMVFQNGQTHLIFFGIPTSSSEKLKKYGIASAAYQVDRDQSFRKTYKQTNIINTRLVEVATALKWTSKALRRERQKHNRILCDMLPVKVAKSLKQGKVVKPERFTDSTVLFSDFEDIAEVAGPMQMVTMLNKLCVAFDANVWKYNVVKIQTKSDAYMVVGGVHDFSRQHAAAVLCFALEMINLSQEVDSPVTGKPVQIRIGVHSGSVVAGVLGVKVPHYCVFGDTVTTALKMEKHGESGKIHCSQTTYSFLKDNEDFVFEQRKETNGIAEDTMTTYFLISGEKDKYTQEREEIISKRDSVVERNSMLSLEKTQEPNSKLCNII